MGYLPGVYLEEIKRKPVVVQAQLPENDRLNTLTSVLGGGGSSEEGSGDSRASSLMVGVEARRGKKEDCW